LFFFFCVLLFKKILRIVHPLLPLLTISLLLTFLLTHHIYISPISPSVASPALALLRALLSPPPLATPPPSPHPLLSLLEALSACAEGVPNDPSAGRGDPGGHASSDDEDGDASAACDDSGVSASARRQLHSAGPPLLVSLYHAGASALLAWGADGLPGIVGGAVQVLVGVRAPFFFIGWSCLL
jgi:hypothetical protein